MVILGVGTDSQNDRKPALGIGPEDVGAEFDAIGKWHANILLDVHLIIGGDIFGVCGRAHSGNACG